MAKSNEYSIKNIWANSQIIFLVSYVPMTLSAGCFSFSSFSSILLFRYLFFSFRRCSLFDMNFFHSAVESFVLDLSWFCHHDCTRKTKKCHYTYDPSSYLKKRLCFSLSRIWSSNTCHGTYFQLPIEINYDNKLHISLMKHQMPHSALCNAFMSIKLGLWILLFIACMFVFAFCIRDIKDAKLAWQPRFSVVHQFSFLSLCTMYVLCTLYIHVLPKYKRSCHVNFESLPGNPWFPANR